MKVKASRQKERNDFKVSSEERNKIFDTTTYLTKVERSKVEKLSEKLVDSIFKRESDPVKRNLLLKLISTELNYCLALDSSMKVSRILMKQKEKKEGKTVKLESSKIKD